MLITEDFHRQKGGGDFLQISRLPLQPLAALWGLPLSPITAFGKRVFWAAVRGTK